MKYRITIAASVLGAALGLFFFVVFVIPNDHRVDFPFPELPETTRRRQMAVDFLSIAEQARLHVGVGDSATVDAFEKARNILKRHPAANTSESATGSRRVVQVTLDSSTTHWVRRRALYAPAPSEYEFTLTVPPEATLEFHFGLLPKVSGADEPGIRFVVESVSENEKARVIFSSVAVPASIPLSPLGRFTERNFLRFLDVQPGGDPWQSAVVDLKPWQGKTIRLKFRTEPFTGKSDSFGLPHGFWACPAIWTTPNPKITLPDNLILMVVDSLRPDDVPESDHGQTASPWNRMRNEGVTFENYYCNATAARWSFLSLLYSRSDRALGLVSSGNLSPEQKDEFNRLGEITLAEALRRQGYRTAAIGAVSFLANTPNGGVDMGFDEVHSLELDGYEPVHAALNAVDWLARQPGGPFFLTVYFRQTASPPLRFWTETLTKLRPGAGGWRRWSHLARVDYAGEYIGRLLDVLDAMNAWNSSLAILVPCRGEEFQPSPVRLLPAEGDHPGRPAWRLVSNRDAPLSERNIRTVSMIRHKKIPAGQRILDRVQSLDLAPTALKILGRTVPDGFQGTPIGLSNFPRSYESPTSQIVIHGETGRVLLIDGHFKYVRRNTSSSLTQEGERFLSPLHAEELYDLWVDPEEKRDISRAERRLLARTRRVLDEMDPDPTETLLSFRGLDQVVTGSVQLPAGNILEFGTTGISAQRGVNQYDFEIAPPSGEVRFRSWPGYSVFVLKTSIGKGTFPSNRIRCSRYGLPLLEPGGESWYDNSDFPLLEGKPPAVTIDEPSTGPLLFIGRSPSPETTVPLGSVPGLNTANSEDPDDN